MTLKTETILVLSPHTDDAELGCGAAIARWTEEGKQVHYAAFSLCETSLAPGLPVDTLEKECRTATSLLGIEPAHLYFFKFPVREFPAYRQPILEELVALNKKINPQLVVFPSATDVHQDHQVIHQEAIRAFKFCSMIGYEQPWNNKKLSTDLFVTLSESHLEKKVAALKAYSSQAHRNYMQGSFIHSLASVRGLQAGNSLAEAFEVYNWIL